MPDQNGDDVAEIVEDRLDHDIDENTLDGRSDRRADQWIESRLQPVAAPVVAVVRRDNVANGGVDVTVGQRPVRLKDIDVEIVRSEDAQLRVDDDDAVDIRRCEGRSQDLADRDRVPGDHRLDDVGALREPRETPRDVLQRRENARPGEPRIAFQPLGELLLGQPGQL